MSVGGRSGITRLGGAAPFVTAISSCSRARSSWRLAWPAGTAATSTPALRAVAKPRQRRNKETQELEPPWAAYRRQWEGVAPEEQAAVARRAAQLITGGWGAVEWGLPNQALCYLIPSAWRSSQYAAVLERERPCSELVSLIA